MPRCCQGATCSCLIQASGAHMTVTGAGSSQDPYILTPNYDLTVTDSSVFNLSLTGAGTAASPWVLAAAFAATAKLDDLPDVNAPTPTNAQVLGWDSGTSKWTARAPTTAASGSVTHDTSLSGDGSGGSPLQVVEDPAGFLVTAAAGLGLSDTGKNRIVRHHVSSAARGSATPAPDLNALTMLDTAPGRIDYWNGTAWVEQGQFDIDFGSGQLLALSGGYTGGRLTMMVRQVTDTTDVDGLFEVLSSTDLSGFAGVLSAAFQPVGALGYAAVLETNVTEILGRAYKLTDGTYYGSQGVAGVVTAWLY